MYDKSITVIVTGLGIESFVRAGRLDYELGIFWIYTMLWVDRKQILLQKIFFIFLCLFIQIKYM